MTVVVWDGMGWDGMMPTTNRLACVGKMNQLAAWVLALITVALISVVFMLPLLLDMGWISFTLSGWLLFLIVIVIVLIQWGHITKVKAKDRMMWA